jgi:hypothetical protein
MQHNATQHNITSYLVGITRFLGYVYRPVIQKHKGTQGFEFPSSGEGWETPALLGSVERGNPNHWLFLTDPTE